MRKEVFLSSDSSAISVGKVSLSAYPLGRLDSVVGSRPFSLRD